VPRLLLFIAAVATAARAGGIGPGVFATATSIAAIVLPSFHQLLHDAAFAERVVMFLVCALIGILVSAPRAKEPPVRTPAATQRR
jgi:membrane protein implicated in regulation of membrane protease activity